MRQITLVEATAAMSVVTGGDEVLSIEIVVNAGRLDHVTVETATARLPAVVKSVLPWTDHWRAEADAYVSGLLLSLVDGLRAPQLYSLIELGEDGVRLWLEDVVHTDLEWTGERIVEAAGLLGRMSRLYLVMSETPPLRDGFLEELSHLPRSLGHGDARPANLLSEGADPHRFVLVNWEHAAWWPVGFDLAALLANAADVETEAIAAFCEAGFEPDAVEEAYQAAQSRLEVQ